jgi:gas vesicle protein
MSDQDSGSSLAWFLAGAALGAAGALLFAPQSGRETREILRQRAAEGRERASEYGREARDRGREYYERSREYADRAAEKGRAAAEKGKEFLDRGRQMADDATSRFRRNPDAAADEVESAAQEALDL